MTSTTVDGMSNRNVRTNAAGVGQYHRVVFDEAENIPQPATHACGPALRLTGSHSQLTGAAWYPRQMNVREGFDTTFMFRLSNPSTHCKFMDDVYTHCRARGGDGFAFVIQNYDQVALGKGGNEMSYGGIRNSVAIEFDTQFNYEQLDPYENHISVQTRGWREANSANHSYSLGSTSKYVSCHASVPNSLCCSIPDLTDGSHTARIVYTPEFEEDLYVNKFQVVRL